MSRHRPLYARLLRLHHVTPSGLLCFVFFEGAVALGLLLGLAELVSWWGVLVLPAMVALMVKLNDVVAGSLARAATSARARPVRPAAEPARAADGPGEQTTRLPGPIEREEGPLVDRPWAERVEIRHQLMRQSATRRYE